MSMNLNISIPHSLLMQIKQQLQYNKLFQQIHKMPNMIAEREFLRKATDPVNFIRIEKVHNKAKNKFMDNKHECQAERRRAAKLKDDIFKVREKLRRELREVKKKYDGMGDEIKAVNDKLNKVSKHHQKNIQELTNTLKVDAELNAQLSDDLARKKRALVE